MLHVTDAGFHVSVHPRDMFERCEGVKLETPENPETERDEDELGSASASFHLRLILFSMDE